MGKIGLRKYKHKPTGKMIKEIKQMAPGKKIGGQMVYPMAATRPFGVFSAIGKAISSGVRATARPINKALGTGRYNTTTKFARPTTPYAVPARNNVISNPGILGSKSKPLQMSSMDDLAKRSPSVTKFRPMPLNGMSRADKLKQIGAKAQDYAQKGLLVYGVADALNGVRQASRSAPLPPAVKEDEKQFNQPTGDGIGYGPQSNTTNTRIINNYYGGGRGQKSFPTSTRGGGGPYTRDMLMPQRSGSEYGKYNDGGRIYSTPSTA